jgi:hypothetical protein
MSIGELLAKMREIWKRVQGEGLLNPQTRFVEKEERVAF